MTLCCPSMIISLPFSSSGSEPSIRNNPHISFSSLFSAFQTRRLPIKYSWNIVTQYQIRLFDIKKVNNIWFLHIEESEEIRVKTKSAIRKVPVHPQLIDLGCIDSEYSTIEIIITLSCYILITAWIRDKYLGDWLCYIRMYFSHESTVFTTLPMRETNIETQILFNSIFTSIIYR